jgi:hypothetical protein
LLMAPGSEHGVHRFNWACHLCSTGVKRVSMELRWVGSNHGRPCVAATVARVPASQRLTGVEHPMGMGHDLVLM